MTRILLFVSDLGDVHPAHSQHGRETILGGVHCNLWSFETPAAESYGDAFSLALHALEHNRTLSFTQIGGVA